jgi:hypothetical protein
MASVTDLADLQMKLGAMAVLPDLLEKAAELERDHWIDNGICWETFVQPLQASLTKNGLGRLALWFRLLGESYMCVSLQELNTGYERVNNGLVRNNNEVMNDFLIADNNPLDREPINLFQTTLQERLNQIWLGLDGVLPGMPPLPLYALEFRWILQALCRANDPLSEDQPQWIINGLDPLLLPFCRKIREHAETGRSAHRYSWKQRVSIRKTIERFGKNRLMLFQAAVYPRDDTLLLKDLDEKKYPGLPYLEPLGWWKALGRDVANWSGDRDEYRRWLADTYSPLEGPLGYSKLRVRKRRKQVPWLVGSLLVLGGLALLQIAAVCWVR